jgi:nucleoside-diphosphate-sugar epimerase
VLEQVRSGRARRIVKPGQVFSRIHVDDIVGVLRASMARPNPGAIYNVCDDEPEAPDRVVEYACTLLGVTPPEPVAFEDAGLSDMAKSFYADNKRVRNDRIKNELGVVLRHPSYREGMAADLAHDRD